MDQNDTMRTGALYIRVSTGKQEELSPDAQRRLLLDYAAKNNIIISNQYIYEEDGISGRRADKRPKFQEMIAHAKSKEHPFDVILVWKFSRFARNQEESIVYKSMLKRDHVDVISVSEPLIEGPFGSLIERIIEWMDEYYSIRLSGEVFRGMTENALRGNFQARPPLGYTVLHSKETPVVVPEKATIVRLIYDLYTNQGISLYGIAKKLNELGYKTNRGKPFERRSIRYILENPFYSGKVAWNRHATGEAPSQDHPNQIIQVGKHEAIISQEQFDRAQQRLIAEYIPRNSKPPESHRHWLSGMVKCHSCGRSLAVSMHRDKRYGRLYTNFQCCGYHKGKCQVSHQISERKLVPAVLTGIENIVSGAVPLEFKVLEQSAESDQSAITLLKERIADIGRKEERIRQAYRDGIDTIDEYRDNKNILQQERTELQQKLDTLSTTCHNEAITPQQMLEKLRNVYELLVSENVTTADKNAALRSIVDYIEYDSENKEISIFLYCAKSP